jgi:hypothetical protein
MKSKGPLSCSKELATGPSPEPDYPGRAHTPYFFDNKIHFVTT